MTTNPFDALPRLAFIIGAQKAGTTFLAGLLDQHPEICLSIPKEPQFFSFRYDRGLGHYASQFPEPTGSVLLDASTSYTMLRAAEDLDREDAPGNAAPVPERIHALNPDAKLIYVLRDPAERAASAYRHMRKASGAPSGPVSLMACLRERPILELTSRYSVQAERYLDVFPRENLHFVAFRRLKAEPADVARECFAFLGLPHHEVVQEDAGFMRNRSYAMSGFGRMVLRVRRSAPDALGIIRMLLPQAARSRMRGIMRKEEVEIFFTDMDETRAHFADEIRRVRDLTGIEI